MATDLEDKSFQLLKDFIGKGFTSVRKQDEEETKRLEKLHKEQEQKDNFEKWQARNQKKKDKIEKSRASRKKKV